MYFTTLFNEEDNLSSIDTQKKLCKFSVLYYNVKLSEKKKKVSQSSVLKITLDINLDSESEQEQDTDETTDSKSSKSSESSDPKSKEAEKKEPVERKSFHVTRIYPKIQKTVELTKEDLVQFKIEMNKVKIMFKKDYIENKRDGTYKYQIFNTKGDMVFYVSSYKVGDSELMWDKQVKSSQ